MPRLTDKVAIRIALLIARDSELALIDAYRDVTGKIMEDEPGVQLARRNVAAFERVLTRHYGEVAPPKLPAGKPISILATMNVKRSRTFDPNAT